MKQRTAYNPKRQLADAQDDTTKACAEQAQRATYTGNAHHKKRPNDYGLTPATDPRPGKTLCDADGQFSKDQAVSLLLAGAKLRMVSKQVRNGWPQNIWAVGNDGEAFEAQLENQELGHYHGYPMPAEDDFRKVILDEWKKRAHVSDD